MNIKEMISILTAADAGYEIEYCASNGSSWIPHDDGIWDFYNFDYRIKPALREALEWVALLDNKTGNLLAGAPNVLEMIQVPNSVDLSSTRIIHVREVIE